MVSDIWYHFAEGTQYSQCIVWLFMALICLIIKVAKIWLLSLCEHIVSPISILCMLVAFWPGQLSEAGYSLPGEPWECVRFCPHLCWQDGGCWVRHCPLHEPHDKVCIDLWWGVCVCGGGGGRIWVGLGRVRRVEREGNAQEMYRTNNRKNTVHLIILVLSMQGDLHLSNQGTIKPKVSGLQKDVWWNECWSADGGCSDPYWSSLSYHDHGNSQVHVCTLTWTNTYQTQVINFIFHAISRAGSNGTAGMAMAIPDFEAQANLNAWRLEDLLDVSTYGESLGEAIL